ncbi:MAG: beta-CASP ribonuclease aCPSF1 [DPANN group archaeon]|nr:beta-CASP ribonuclease aCPSF1 [DPANN group archaeon]
MALDLKSKLPPGSMITGEFFEGSDIIFYTKSKSFFINGADAVKPLVKEYKKRIEIRPDKQIRLDEESAKKLILEIIPKEAGVEDIRFEPEFSKVIIYAKKPGLVIGKYGVTLNKIKEDVCWVPETKRVPMFESKLVDKIRDIIHSETKYRHNFLNRIGEQIQLNKGSKDGWVRMSFLGSAREVGRSALLLQTKKTRVLLDCGINPSSSQKNAYLEAPEFNIEDLDAIVISHAHMDHMGFLPYLYEYGYEGPIYLTPPTRDIMVLQQLEYIKLMQNETGGAPYTSRGVKSAIKHTITLNYGSVCDITPDMRLTLQNAGHILGSSLVHLHVGEGLHNILYTGDFKYGKSRLFDVASTNFQRVETLVMESTYCGSKDMTPNKFDAEKVLINTITKVMKRRGKVIIPSFAVGRAQELMVFFAEKARSGELNVPIYLDGMIWDATAIHTTYPEFLSESLQKQIFHHMNNPFVSEIFKRIGGAQERKNVIDGEPCVILTTSGMLNGGPVIEYLRHLAADPLNALIFVGYQAEGTLGRHIQMGWKEIPLSSTQDDKRVNTHINLEIANALGFGAHSDRSQLMSYINHLKTRPERIILNHGEAKKIVDFTRYLHKTLKCETIAPHNLDAISLTKT